MCNLKIAALLALSLSLAGCAAPDPKPAGFPDTVPCVITITQENAPLADATVSLIPSDGAKDWIFSAVTDAFGNARVFTYGRQEGAPKGKYKVVVTKTESDPSKFAPPADENNTAEWERYEQNAANEKLNTYTLVEAVYTSAETTPLKLEITGKTTQTFDIGKKVRIVLPK